MTPIRKIIVVPVFNEASSVVRVVNSILHHMDNDTRLILVQDGSDDGTEEILKNLSDTGFLKEHAIDLVNHSVNQGYGKALLSGFTRALEYKNAEYILTMDCDEQHQPEDIEKFFSYPHNEILSGSRYLLDIRKGIQAPQDRVEINKKITEKYVKLAFRYFKENWHLTDTFCGMKRYSRQFIETFLGQLSAEKKKKYWQDACLGYGFPLIVWNFFLLWLQKEKKTMSSSFAEIAIPKIYISNDRTFGVHLDFPRKRYKYYLKCMRIFLR